MDNTLFESDAVKIECISRLLRQADEMLGDMKSHLRDYAERLDANQPQPASIEGSTLELERLKQAALEKEEETRLARFERIQALEQVQALRETVTALQDQIKKSEQVNSQSAHCPSEAAREQNTADQQNASLRMENGRLTTEINALKRRLERAHQQNERLLRTREELLETLKLSEISIVKPLPEDLVTMPDLLVVNDQLHDRAPSTLE